MTTIDKKARIAGAAYLLLSIVCAVRLIYIPNALFVGGDTAATIAHMVAHPMLLRVGIVSDLLIAVLQLVLALALYRLFEGVSRKLATLMVILGGVMIPVLYLINVLNDVAALLLTPGDGLASVFGAGQSHALALFCLSMYGQVTSAAMIYWGLWLFPMALLVLRSRFLPRLLGYLLILNGLAYIIQCFAWALLPAYETVIHSVTSPFWFGEVIFTLWLLVMGARSGFRRKRREQQLAPT